MSDLISRQAVLDFPIRLDHYDEEHGNRDFVLGIESVMEYVESLPSAEPKTDGVLEQIRWERKVVGEIVRCKDCLLTKERDEYTNNIWCCRHREYMDDTYYCADGLRREDGEADETD